MAIVCTPADFEWFKGLKKSFRSSEITILKATTAISRAYAPDARAPQTVKTARKAPATATSWSRIAVIGTGGWGKNHVRVLSELGNLVAVCDLDASRAAAYAEKYRVKGYSSVDELLEKERPDGVTICTPASTHFAVASKTLKAGVHTFVEKPMTSTVKEAEDLIKEAEKAGKILTVGFIERFNPAITELKKMITKGALGRPILFEYHRENRRGENIVDVGVVKDASVHDIDTARWLFGEEPKTVYARVGSVMGKNEDFATILLGFGDERTAFIITNWVTPSRVRQTERGLREGGGDA